MARYRCNNCGMTFVHDEQTMPVPNRRKCPYCGSTWTVLIGPGLTSLLHPYPYRFYPHISWSFRI